MLSDTVLLALIAAFPASMASACAIIVALRTREKIIEREKYDEGATAARGQRQRRTDTQPEEPPP